MPGLNLLVGTSYNFSTSAPIGSVTEFDEMIVSGILDYTSAMRYINIKGMMEEWKNSTNIQKLKDIDVTARQYYLIDNPNSAQQLVVPDFLILEGSVTKVSPSIIEILVEVGSPSEIDGLKNYLRAAGLEYTIK